MEKLYFSDEIARKLALMHQSGLVMLESPAGYGKTTAVRWALKETPVEALHWFTAMSFLQDAGLDSLLRLRNPSWIRRRGRRSGSWGFSTAAT